MRRATYDRESFVASKFDHRFLVQSNYQMIIATNNDQGRRLHP